MKHIKFCSSTSLWCWPSAPAARCCCGPSSRLLEGSGFRLYRNIPSYHDVLVGALRAVLAQDPLIAIPGCRSVVGIFPGIPERVATSASADRSTFEGCAVAVVCGE